MRTENWIELLASQAEPAGPRRAGPLISRLLPWGVAASLALMLVAYGPRPDLAEVAMLPMFWLKAGAPLAIALAGVVLLHRLGRPGVRGGRAWWGIALPVLLLWLVAAAQWLATAPPERPPLLWGETWRGCVFNIAFIALPSFLAALATLRQLAPTRPRAAGAAAGVLAGGAGAFAYAFHCPELAAPFLAVWYVLGMAMPVVAGALIGPRLLRW